VIEAPYKLPASWEWVRLSEIVQELESGGRPKGGVRGIKSGIPSIGGEHLSNEGGFDFHSIRFVPLSFAKSMRKGRVKIDDILIVKDGATTGKTSFVGEDFLYPMAVLNEHVFRLRVYPDVAEQRYVFHYLRSPLGQKMIADSFRGSAQGGINQGFTEFVTVPVAPLREQRRITERLRLVFNRIASAKRGLLSSPPLLHRLRQLILAKAFRGELTERDPNDEPAEKLLERVRQERRKKWEESLRAKGKDPRKHKYEEADVFDTEELPILPYTWAWTTIGAIASFIGSGITPLGGQNVYVSKGIPFIRSQNVYPSGIHLEDIVYITPEMHAEMKRTHVRPDDVLLNITGASIGRSTYVPPCFGEANVNQHVCILRTGWWMIPSYLSNFLLELATGTGSDICHRIRCHERRSELRSDSKDEDSICTSE